MYFTDRGIEELEDRRGEEEVTLAWLAERLRVFVDLNPDFEVAVDRLATWLARLDEEQDLLSRTGRGACLPGKPAVPWQVVPRPGPRRPCRPRRHRSALAFVCGRRGTWRHRCRPW
jgi:hypothetical protein